MHIRKPTIGDLPEIEKLLEQWVLPDEVLQTIQLIAQTITAGYTSDRQYFVIEDENKVAGIGGIANAPQKLSELSKSSNPGQITLLYLDKTIRGKGFGSMLLEFLEREASKHGYTELFARSQGKNECVAYDFYGHKGYDHIATFEGDFAAVVFRKPITQ